MKITYYVFQQTKLFAETNFPAEVGGALGIKNGVIIDFLPDIGLSVEKMGVYVPNTELINEKLRIWTESNISFGGIFHSHPDCSNSLSNDDIFYIQKIMDCMPSNIVFLYFPLVLPSSGNMVAFKAVKNSCEFSIVREDIEIV